MANTNIAMGYQGVQLQNPLDAYAKVMGIQHAQNQNELAQYQMASARRADENQNALNQTIAGFTPGMKFEDQYNALVKTPGGLDAARKFAESHAKVTKDQREGDKAAEELAVKRMEKWNNYLPTVNSPERYTAWRDGMLKDLPGAASIVPQEYSPENVMGLAAKAEDMLKKHYVNRDAGATKDTVAISPITGQAVQVPGSEIKVTSTPHQIALEKAARDRLTQETAPGGTLSPETVDFLAETYRQTGSLPSLGMGKVAAETRNKVLGRAAELAMGGGKTAADAAGDVRGAKADTAGATATVKDFSSGMSARRVTANNTAINHLATMEQLASDLNNNDIRVFNAAANMFAKATGATAPTSFDAARQLVASEVIKAVVNNGGGVTERKEAEEQFARANSPEQLKGVIKTYKELLAGQLDSLRMQYETGTGRKDFDKKLTPETRKTFEAVRGKSAPVAPANVVTNPNIDALLKKYER